MQGAPMVPYETSSSDHQGLPRDLGAGEAHWAALWESYMRTRWMIMTSTGWAVQVPRHARLRYNVTNHRNGG